MQDQPPRYVFWQNMLAIHQSAHIRALSESVPVTLVGEQELAADRRGMGWPVPDFGGARIIVGPDRREVAGIVRSAGPDAMHIIGGFRGYSLHATALAECLGRGVKCALMTEDADPRGAMGAMRRMLYGYRSARLSRRLSFLLAMGERACRWYEACGFPSTKVFEYAYLTETPEHSAAAPLDSRRGSPVRLLYIGQCIPRKGVDLAIQALCELQSRNWTFTLVGEGPLLPALKEMCDRSPIRDRVVFRDYLPYGEALDTISQHDLLLLPSRYDGWGAVVNEALMRGTAVICADSCGASSLLGGGERGSVYRSESCEDLVGALERWIRQGPATQTRRREIAEWSGCISGAAAARYLQAICRHVFSGGARPVAPWRLSEVPAGSTNEQYTSRSADRNTR